MARSKSKTARHRRNLRRRVFSRDDYRCVDCGRKHPEGGLTLDHIIPKSKGGAGTAANLQAMCLPCNQRKADRMPDRIELHPWHPEIVGSRGRQLEAA